MTQHIFGSTKKYIALLDEHELEALLDCGCKMVRNGYQVALFQCPTHMAAPELLEALEAMLKGADLVMTETLDGGNPFPTLSLAAEKATAVIAKAEANTQEVEP